MTSSLARRLATPTWKVADYMGKPRAEGPDMGVLRKVIKLSGLTADPTEIQSDLAHQLQFVEVLQAIDTEDVKPLSRLVMPVTCPDINAVPEQQDPPEWSPTDLAAVKQNGYYVVKKQLGA